jgi:hypothetical protein
MFLEPSQLIHDRETISKALAIINSLEINKAKEEPTEILLLFLANQEPKKITTTIAKEKNIILLQEVMQVTFKEEEIKEIDADIIVNWFYPNSSINKSGWTELLGYMRCVFAEFYRITFDHRLKQFSVPRQPKEDYAVIKAEANLWKITLKMLQDLATFSKESFSAIKVLQHLICEKSLLPVSLNRFIDNNLTKTEFIKEIKRQNGRIREGENPFEEGTMTHAVVDDAIKNSERYSIFNKESYRPMIKARVELVRSIEKNPDIKIYRREGGVEHRGRKSQKRVLK